MWGEPSLQKKKQPKCANCKGPHVASYKGCPAYKKQAFRQHVVDNQKSYAAILRQNTAPPQPQDMTFTFSAEPVEFVANAAIQVAQSQVCNINSSQDAMDKKSSMCRGVSEASTAHLGVIIAGSNLFDAIGHLRPPAPSVPKLKTFLTKNKAPFKFTSSTKVTKPSAILETLSSTNKPSKIVPRQSKTSQ